MSACLNSATFLITVAETIIVETIEGPQRPLDRFRRSRPAARRAHTSTTASIEDASEREQADPNRGQSNGYFRGPEPGRGLLGRFGVVVALVAPGATASAVPPGTLVVVAVDAAGCALAGRC